MRITGQEEGPQSAEDFEVFKGLHLIGTSGKVNVKVTERKLSIEQRKGHTTEIAHEWVMRLNHSQKPLFPNGYAGLGLVLLWVGYRGLIFGTASQMLTIGLGLVFLFGRFGIKRPLLTIETQAHDCHMITGNDATLMRLCELHNRLTEGMTMEQAKLGLDQLNRDTDFPRINAERIIPAEPIHLDSPLPIATLLATHGNGGQMANAEPPLNLLRAEEQLDLDFGEPMNAGWMFGEPELEPQDLMNHGLIQRGRANAQTRRHALPGPQPGPRDGTYTHHPAHPYPSPQAINHGRSYGQITEAQPARMEQQVSHPHDQVPTEFLPSFVGPEGAHVPRHMPPVEQEIVEFESNLDELFSEPEPSLVTSARLEETLDAELVHELTQPPAKQNAYIMRRKTSGFANPRWLQRQNRFNGGTRMQSFIHGIKDSATIASKLFTGTIPASPAPRPESETGHELRERSAKTHQEEIESSVANLSDTHGGVLPAEVVERMTSHFSRRHTLVEQIEQERKAQEATSDLDGLSFEDFTERVENHKTTAGVSGLPRLDL